MIIVMNNNNILDQKDSILNIFYRYISCYSIEIIHYFE